MVAVVTRCVLHKGHAEAKEAVEHSASNIECVLCELGNEVMKQTG
jgi:hypothetical protein